MGFRLKNPNSPHKSRHYDPSTSQDDSGTNLESVKERVYHCLKDNGELTAEQVSKKLKINQQSITTRFTDLLYEGRVVPTSKRRQNQSGKYAQLYRVCSKKEQNVLADMLEDTNASSAKALKTLVELIVSDPKIHKRIKKIDDGQLDYVNSALRGIYIKQLIQNGKLEQQIRKEVQKRKKRKKTKSRNKKKKV